MFSKEILNEKIIYTDSKNNEIEVLLNKDPILDVNNKYKLDFFLKNKELLDYIIKDIQTNYNKMYYLTNEYNANFEQLLTSYNFKIMSYRVSIPYKNQNNTNKLSNIKNDSLWEEYMLKNINALFSQNSKYLENNTYKNYTKEHLAFMKEHDTCEVLYNNDLIIGSICYGPKNFKEVTYIRDIYGEDKNIIKEILEMILSKYQKRIILDIIFTYKDLLEVIKDLDGIIENVTYRWKGNN